jgi:hypothetical protein
LPPQPCGRCNRPSKWCHAASAAAHEAGHVASL